MFEGLLRGARDHLRDRGLSRARRAPQDHRRQPVGLDQHPQRLARSQQVLLAHHLVERCGAAAGPRAALAGPIDPRRRPRTDPWARTLATWVLATWALAARLPPGADARIGCRRSARSGSNCATIVCRAERARGLALAVAPRGAGHLRVSPLPAIHARAEGRGREPDTVDLRPARRTDHRIRVGARHPTTQHPTPARSSPEPGCPLPHRFRHRVPPGRRANQRTVHRAVLACSRPPPSRPRPRHQRHRRRTPMHDQRWPRFCTASPCRAICRRSSTPTACSTPTAWPSRPTPRWRATVRRGCR